MTQPVVRELLVTDLRCGYCGAEPGSRCFSGVGAYSRVDGVPQHVLRINEHMELVEAGWQWQEVDPTDIGAKPR